MKKVIRYLILLLSVFYAISTVAFSADFSDIQSEQLKTTLNDLVRFKIINGYSDGTYRPNNNVSRAEFSKIIIELIKPEVITNDTTQWFPDVTSVHWAFRYINNAADMGIVSGYPNGNFYPNESVTYEQAMKMLVEALSYGRYATQKGGYPNGYISVAEDIGIMRGVICNYKDHATRGNIALMTRNALDVPLLGTETIGGQSYLTQSNNTLYQIYNEAYPITE